MSDEGTVLPDVESGTEVNVSANVENILGGEDTSWKTAIPEDIRSEGVFDGLGSVGDLAKGYLHAQKLVSKKGLTAPGRESSPEEWTEFFKAIGRPDAPDDYMLPTDGLPEGYTFDKEAMKPWLKEFHEIGLVPRQVASLMRKLANDTHAASQDQQAAEAREIQETTTVLRRELGEAFDESIGIAKGVIRDFGSPELERLVNETSLGNNPELIKMLIKVGKAMGQDEVIGKGRHAQFEHTPLEAQRAIDQKMQNKDFWKIYTDETHPGHEAAVREMERLHQAAAAGG